MKLVMSGGGTGGHVYPALSVLEAFSAVGQAEGGLPILGREDVLWIGSAGGMEAELVQRAGVRFAGLAAGGVRGVGLWTMIRNLARILSSVVSARRLLVRPRASVVLATGGYACVSVTLAAWLARVPVVLYLPDIVPGTAIRFLSRFAAKVAVTSEASMKYLDRSKVVVTGYPVRSGLFGLNRPEARSRLGLEPDPATLLVMGGSRGAHSINRALVAGLPELLTACQIVHISGQRDAEWVAQATQGLDDACARRYHHYAYLHDMPQALAAADLAVARAGAATLGEFPAAGLPSVLAPYPYAGQHQQANAESMAACGAARIVADVDLDAKLTATLLELLGNPQLLDEMKRAARAISRPDAAQSIARLLCATAGIGLGSAGWHGELGQA